MHFFNVKIDKLKEKNNLKTFKKNMLLNTKKVLKDKCF